MCACVLSPRCRVYENLTCLLSATEAPCLPAPPPPLSGRLTPSPRGEDEEEGEVGVEVGVMTGDNGGGVKEKKWWWGGGWG